MVTVVISREWNYNRLSFPIFISETFAIFMINALFHRKETVMLNVSAQT